MISSSHAISVKKRAAHRKSRLGCSNCKRKHVKCDEQGPPCANCITRNTTTTCSFEISLPTRTRDSRPSSSSHVFDVPHAEVEYLDPSLELELMHRWTSVTYQCVVQLRLDAHYHQIEIPRAALSAPYLLYSVFALSALDLAVRGWVGEAWSDVPNIHPSNAPLDRQKYIQAALHYHAKACSEFRLVVSAIDEKSLHCAYMTACHIFIVNLALPRCVPSAHPETTNSDSTEIDTSTNVLTRLGTTFGLIHGAGEIARVNYAWLLNSPQQPLVEAGVRLVEEASAAGLDPPSQEVWARIGAVADAHFLQNDSNKPCYELALASLHLIFLVEDGPTEIHGWCITLPIAASQEFIDAFNQREELALFIIMHWAVFLVREGAHYWWAQNVGRDVLLEIAEILTNSTSTLSDMPEFKDGVEWARQELVLHDSKMSPSEGSTSTLV